MPRAIEVQTATTMIKMNSHSLKHNAGTVCTRPCRRSSAFQRRAVGKKTRRPYSM
ncbi:MAG: hypothetical protein QW348_01620 [Ignisphaera sp.]